MVQQLNNHESRLKEILEMMQRQSDNIDQLKEQLVRLDESKKYVEQVTSIRDPIEQKFKLLVELEAEIPPEKVKLFETLKDQLEAQVINQINAA